MEANTTFLIIVGGRGVSQLLLAFNSEENKVIQQQRQLASDIQHTTECDK